MAIQVLSAQGFAALKTQVATRSVKASPSTLATSNPRFATDFSEALGEIQDSLVAIEQLMKTRRKALTASKSIFVVDQGDSLKNSPAAPGASGLKIDPESLGILEKNSTVIQRLHDTLDALDTLKTNLLKSFPEGSREVAKQIQQLEVTRQSATGMLNEAYNELQVMASRHAPAAFTALGDKLAVIVSNTLSYETSEAFVYAFEVDGAICFSYYLHLVNLTADDGAFVPDMYVVLSYSSGSTKFYLDVNRDWVQPSSTLFVKTVTDPKTMVRGLANLLATDSFSSNIGNVPFKLLDTPHNLKKKLRSSEAVTQFVMDDDTGALIFYLRPEIKDKTEAARIANELYNDVKLITKRSTAQLRMNILESDDPKRSKSRRAYRVVFTLNLNHGRLAATVDDLKFMREKFGQSDGQIRQILRILNSEV